MPHLDNNILRNFCIIAHIDHGKSTLADRLLELTGTIEKRNMKDQVLDQMDLERERGITIKLQPVRMTWKGHVLNLIDTPGHVDFSYEVSRSLAAVEGVILVVDATQGVEAQTLAHLHIARKQGLSIIPVINKIDLPAAEVEKVTKEVMALLPHISKEDVIAISAKKGEHVSRVLDAVVEKVPPPAIPDTDQARALIFDSYFDDYRGVIAYVRVISGIFSADEKIIFMGADKKSDIAEVGVFRPQLSKKDSLAAGEIGYIVTGLKSLEGARVGDTITLARASASTPLPGYREVKPFVFAGVYPQNGTAYQTLREALEKIKLSDAALTFEVEKSPLLGPGFRCGFLGLLHLEIFQERLKREYEIGVTLTTPTVEYQIKTHKGETLLIRSPHEFPDPSSIREVREPYMRIEIITPARYIGNLMKAVEEKRGQFENTEYVDTDRVVLHYFIPLSSILTDFYDTMKSVSSGYASLHYTFHGWRVCQVSKMDILVAEKLVPSLSTLVYQDEAYQEARRIVDALKKALPRQLFEIKIQAAIGGKIIASSRISALRKDVTAKLYGGDITRRRKLLEKQKKGKKRMKQRGTVAIPQEAFLAILRKSK